MKKLVVGILLGLVYMSTVFAGNTFVENISGKGGTGITYVNYNRIYPEGNFPQFKVNLREFYAERKNEYTVTNQGHLIVQGKDWYGEDVRLSVRLDKPAVYYQYMPYLYVYTSGRITYWKKGMSPVTVDTNHIGWAYSSNTNTVDIWGGYDTAYNFVVYNIEVE